MVEHKFNGSESSRSRLKRPSPPTCLSHGGGGRSQQKHKNIMRIRDKDSEECKKEDRGHQKGLERAKINRGGGDRPGPAMFHGKIGSTENRRHQGARLERNPPRQDRRGHARLPEPRTPRRLRSPSQLLGRDKSGDRQPQLHGGTKERRTKR